LVYRWKTYQKAESIGDIASFPHVVDIDVGDVCRQIRRIMFMSSVWIVESEPGEVRVEVWIMNAQLGMHDGKDINS